MSVSVCLSVTEVHWRIMANLGLNSDPNLTRIAVAVHAGAKEGIAGKSGGIISRYASHC